MRRPQGQGVENRDSEGTGGREGKSCGRKNFGNRVGGKLVTRVVPEMGGKSNFHHREHREHGGRKIRKDFTTETPFGCAQGRLRTRRKAKASNHGFTDEHG